MMRRRRRHGDRSERGAVLVELTLIVPVLVTIVLGMFEIGMAWSASQNVVQASRSGARTVSQLGTYARSDEEALRAVLSTFGDDTGNVRRVTIYEFNTAAADGVPAGCENASVLNVCNTYVTADFAMVGTNPAHFASETGCVSAQASFEFCPEGRRNNSQQNATLVGVEVEYAHAPVTGFFGVADRIITQRLVMRIEPG